MAQLIRQNTATYILLGPVLSKTDGITPLTSETLTIKYVAQSDTGSTSPTAIAGTAVHMADGWYKVPLTTGETNVSPGRYLLYASGANSLPVHARFQVASQAVYDKENASTAVTDATIATAVWTQALPGSFASGTAGNIIGNRVDAAVSSRMATFTLPTNFSSLSINSSGQMTVGGYGTGMSPASLILTNSTNKLTTDASGQVTVGAYGSGQTPANYILATPANKLTTDASGNITVGTYASGQSPATLILSTPANKLASDASGRITVGGYASGQSPADLVLSTPANKLMTDNNGYVVTGINQDKTGYSLSQAFPANFSALAISATTGRVTVGTNLDKTGYSLTQAFPTNFATLAINGSGYVTSTNGGGGSSADPWAADLSTYGSNTAGNLVYTNLDRKLSSYLDATISSRMATFALPTNFSSLAVSAAGKVTVGTNDDKLGYALNQSFPANFSSLIISGGKVTVGVNDDKTGYTVSGLSSGVITSATFATGALTSGVIDSGAANKIADALLDRTDGVEAGLTMRGAMRLTTSVLAGKMTGADGLTITFRNALADSKNRVVSTVDTNGNRTAITVDPT